MFASVPLKKEAPGKPGEDQPERQFNAPRRGRRAKSREAVLAEEARGSNKDEAHP
jgi:hypothetical protein